MQWTDSSNDMQTPKVQPSTPTQRAHDLQYVQQDAGV